MLDTWVVKLRLSSLHVKYPRFSFITIFTHYKAPSALIDTTSYRKIENISDNVGVVFAGMVLRV